MNNIEMLDSINKIVYGHSNAKKTLINTFNRIKTRYLQHFKYIIPAKECVKVNNCLLLGESGTGKTYLIDQLSKLYDVPMLTLDTTQLEPTGSADKENAAAAHIKNIKLTASKLVEKYPNKYFSQDGAMSQIVIFLDEVDKLTYQGACDWDKKIQKSWLKVIDGSLFSEFVFPPIFVFAGVFGEHGCATEEKSLGFHNDNLESRIEDFSEVLVRSGLLSEFVGRIGNIVKLDKLTKTDYKNIINTHLLPKLQKDMISLCGKELDIHENEVLKLITTTIKNKTGVRGLDMLLSKLFNEFEFDCFSEAELEYSETEKYILDGDIICN